MVPIALPTTVWTAPAQGEDAHTAVGRIMAAFPDRAGNAIVLTAAHLDHYTGRHPDVSATSLVPRPRHAADPATRTQPTRAEIPTPTTLPRPGSSAAADTSACPTNPPKTLRGVGGLRGAGGDQDVDVDADGDRRSGASTIGVDPAAAPGGRAMLDPAVTGSRRWDLVVLELGCRLADDGLGLLGADLLAPGGVLAVLTHSEQADGRLLDPTGSVVSSAQAADLLYLQHIVLLTDRLHPTPPTSGPDGEPHADHTTADAPGSDAFVRGDGVSDLLLFLQPGEPAPSTSTDPTRPGMDSPPGTEPRSSGTARADRPKFGGAA